MSEHTAPQRESLEYYVLALSESKVPHMSIHKWEMYLSPTAFEMKADIQFGWIPLIQKIPLCIPENKPSCTLTQAAQFSFCFTNQISSEKYLM